MLFLLLVERTFFYCFQYFIFELKDGEILINTIVFVSIVNQQVMMTIYPEFIAPLFDKYTALPESSLKTKIEELASKLNFPLKKLYVVHGLK